MFSPKWKCTFLEWTFLFHIAAFDVHYFLLANQSACLSGQMRSSYADKRGFPLFICWENIHIDTLLSTVPTRRLHRRLHRLRAEGRRHRRSSGEHEERSGSRFEQGQELLCALQSLQLDWRSSASVAFIFHLQWICSGGNSEIIQYMCILCNFLCTFTPLCANKYLTQVKLPLQVLQILH